MKEFSFSRPRPRSSRIGQLKSWLPAVILLAVLGAVGLVFLRPPATLLVLRSRLFSALSPATPATNTQELQRALAVMTDRYQQLADTQKMNAAATTHHWSLVTAHITGSNSTPSAPFIIIDQGALRGIRVGMPVVVDGTAIIGTIASVGPGTASVLPLTHPSSRIAVAVENAQRTIGVVQGSANLALELLLVARSEHIQIHELMITSGSQAFIPRGLVVGEIRSIDDTPANIFLEATVAPAADPSRWGTVGVITATQSP